MIKSMVAKHSNGKDAMDQIFSSNVEASKAAQEHGEEKVINATIGAIYDENERIFCIPTVSRVLRSLPIEEIISYAPISGLPDYLSSVIELTFANYYPEAYVGAIATAGGTGVAHHTIWNYSECGDTVLTSDWHWGAYSIICREANRKLDFYSLFDEKKEFNLQSFEKKVQETISQQDSLIVIINTPAHNPTGYSLSNENWSNILDICKKNSDSKGKKIILLVDIAYIDYARNSRDVRGFFKQFTGLSDNILIILAFSMSKSFTMYGQRTGAMIGISSSKVIIDEFKSVNQYTSRATWSNINRGAMKLLTTIHHSPTLWKEFIKERDACYNMIQNRAQIFMNESKMCNLNALPYKDGFFISIPMESPKNICNELKRNLIFTIPLKMGIRIAVCSIPTNKIIGMARKISDAIDNINRF